jgi:hypothetical protein
MLIFFVIHVDDESTVQKIQKKVVTNLNYKFQKIPILKMPWVEPIFYEIGVISIVRCHVCTKIERKEKIMLAKWDSIEKHASKRKGSNGKWIMDPKCMHVKNEISHV